MRKIVITGVAAALALGLTACGGNGDGISAATPPASPTASTPSPGDGSAPNGTSPNTPSTPNGPSTPKHSSAPQGSDGGGIGHAQAGNEGLKEKWGQLKYVVAGEYTVGDVYFHTTNDTILYTAGTACPNGDVPPGKSKCTVENLDDWAQQGKHNVSVRYSGHTAVVITETQ